MNTSVTFSFKPQVHSALGNDKPMDSGNQPSKDLKVKLSTSRIAQLMNSDVTQATKLGLFDRLRDCFPGPKRETALLELHRMLHDHGTSSFSRFDHLARMAQRENQALFTLSVINHPDDSQKFDVEYSIDGMSIKTDTINATEKQEIERRLARPTNTTIRNEQIKTIKGFLIDEETINTKAQDKIKQGTLNFQAGGVNKKFDAETGLLRSDSKVGDEDFDRESELNTYAASRPELAGYISTQKKLSDGEKTTLGLDPSHQYARVKIYEGDHVKSNEMDKCLHQLSRDQAKSLLPQIVDMARVLYKNQVAHRDLHMHNLVVHKIEGTDSVHLMAIDFGRTVIGDTPEFEQKKFEDIRYLFNKQGATRGETVGRQFMSTFARTSDVAMKHYPIHKLCERFNEKKIDLESVLSQIGDHLEEDLRFAQQEDDKIDAAFHKASQTLQMAVAQMERTYFGVSFA